MEYYRFAIFVLTFTFWFFLLGRGENTFNECHSQQLPIRCWSYRCNCSSDLAVSVHFESGRANPTIIELEIVGAVGLSAFFTKGIFINPTGFAFDFYYFWITASIYHVISMNLSFCHFNFFVDTLSCGSKLIVFNSNVIKCII